LFLRDAGDTEIGGFGITAADDLLLVEDVRLVAQTCTWVHVAFEDQSVANFFDDQVDAGRRPEQFGRIWVHTHPGNSPQPSSTDEATFTRVFGRSDWAVMFILAQAGQSYARLRFNVGPGNEVILPVEIDYNRPFGRTEFDTWHEEYLANVRVPPPEPVKKTTIKSTDLDDAFVDGWWRDAWSDYMEFESQQPEEAEYGYIRDF